MLELIKNTIENVKNKNLFQFYIDFEQPKTDHVSHWLGYIDFLKVLYYFY